MQALIQSGVEINSPLDVLSQTGEFSSSRLHGHFQSSVLCAGIVPTGSTTESVPAGDAMLSSDGQ